MGGAPETLDSVALKLRHIRWEFASRCDASPPDFWDRSAESLTDRFRNIYVRVAVGQTPCADDGTRLSVSVVNTSTCSTCPFSGNRETEKAHPNRTFPDASHRLSHVFIPANSNLRHKSLTGYTLSWFQMVDIYRSSLLIHDG